MILNSTSRPQSQCKKDSRLVSKVRRLKNGGSPRASALPRLESNRKGISPLVAVLTIGILVIITAASLMVYVAPSGEPTTTDTRTVLVTSTVTTQEPTYVTSVVTQTGTAWETSSLNMTSTVTSTSTTISTSTATSTSTLITTSTVNSTIYVTSTSTIYSTLIVVTSTTTVTSTVTTT